MLCHVLSILLKMCFEKILIHNLTLDYMFTANFNPSACRETFPASRNFDPFYYVMLHPASATCTLSRTRYGARHGANLMQQVLQVARRHPSRFPPPWIFISRKLGVHWTRAVRHSLYGLLRLWPETETSLRMKAVAGNWLNPIRSLLHLWSLLLSLDKTLNTI